MRIAKILLSLSLILSQSIMAADVVENQLFYLEKTFNQQNILVVHALTNSDCKFVANQNGYVDYYWKMDWKFNPATKEEKFWRKEVDGLIRTNTMKRVKFLGINASRDLYRLQLNDLSELRHDLQDTIVEVTASIQGGQCVTKSTLKMGPSAQYRKLSLSRVFCEATVRFGIPTGCKRMVLSGTDADTNEKLKDVTYYAK